MHLRMGLVAALSMILAACGSAAPAPASSPAQPASASAAAAPASQKPAAAPASPSAKPAASGSAPASPAASGPTASGLVKLIVGHSNPIPETMALYTAKDGGFFERNGLDVDVRLIAGGSTAMAAVVSGETPFSHLGGSEALSSAASGADIVVLAITSPVSSFVFEVKDDIKTVEDLKGKRLGVSNIGGSSDIALHVALRQLGLDPDKDVNITAAGSTANRLAALQNGALQGAAELPADAVRLEANGFHRMVDMVAQKIPATGQGIIAQRAYVNAHKDITQKYVDSIVQAGAAAIKDRDRTVEVVKKFTHDDDTAAIGKAFDAYKANTYTPTPLPRPELWADAIWVLGAKNDKIKTFDVNKLVDPSFVQSAIDRGLNK